MNCHTNVLPRPHVFAILNAATSGPDAFAMPIDKKIEGPCIKLASYSVKASVCSNFFFPKTSTSCN